MMGYRAFLQQILDTAKKAAVERAFKKTGKKLEGFVRRYVKLKKKTEICAESS